MPALELLMGDAPIARERHQTRLYLFVFPREIKVGVTSNLRDTRNRHERFARARAECIYLAPARTPAYDRELAITHRFGVKEPRRGRHSEWFPRAQLADVLAAMAA